MYKETCPSHVRVLRGYGGLYLFHCLSVFSQGTSYMLSWENRKEQNPIPTSCYGPGSIWSYVFIISHLNITAILHDSAESNPTAPSHSFSALVSSLSKVIELEFQAIVSGIIN